MSWAEHFAFRGACLEIMNYIQYTLLVKIVKEPLRLPEKKGAGRSSSPMFAFERGHQLYGKYVQQIADLIPCPIRAGGARPRFPAILAEGVVPSKAWQEQQARAAAYYSANFVPWSITQPLVLTPAALRAFIQKLHRISTVLDKGLKRPWKERLHAAGVLHELQHYAHNMLLSKASMAAARQLRFRDRTLWSDEDIAAYKLAHQGTAGDDGAAAAEEIRKLRAMHEARKNDIEHVEFAARRMSWMDNLATQVYVAVRGSGDMSVNSPQQPTGDSAVLFISTDTNILPKKNEIKFLM